MSENLNFQCCHFDYPCFAIFVFQDEFFIIFFCRNDGETPDAICRDGWTPWLCRGLRDVGGKGMEAIEDTKAYRDAFDADLTRSAQPIVSATI